MQQKSNKGEIDTNTTAWCHFCLSNLSVVAAVFRHGRCTATLAIIRRREATSIQCRSLSQARWITVTSSSPAPHFIFLPPFHCFHPNPTSCRAHHPPLPFRQGSSSWRFNIHPFLILQTPRSSTIPTLSACCDARASVVQHSGICQQSTEVKRGKETRLYCLVGENDAIWRNGDCFNGSEIVKYSY